MSWLLLEELDFYPSNLFLGHPVYRKEIIIIEWCSDLKQALETIPLYYNQFPNDNYYNINDGPIIYDITTTAFRGLMLIS